VLKEYAPGFASNPVFAYVLSVLLSSLAAFVFLIEVYHVLTNVRHTLRDVLVGAALATVLLQVTFQVLPLYVRLTKDIVGLQALGGTAILLVWLYVMANVIVLGAEVNWGLSLRRASEEEEAAGLA
jgi:uncharacterized BrkB/YihY/UPF0761 family membrane protein